jgi:hypothetical protein
MAEDSRQTTHQDHHHRIKKPTWRESGVGRIAALRWLPLTAFGLELATQRQGITAMQSAEIKPTTISQPDCMHENDCNVFLGLR